MSKPDFSKFLAPIATKMDAVEGELQRLVKGDADIISRLAKHVSKGSGKRLRPAIVLLASKFSGCDSDEDVRYAAVFEIIHNATLIHDDVIDNASTRRGRPSLNAAWGNPQSVLFGDFLYMQAMRSALEGRSWKILDILLDVTSRMTTGELIQNENLYNLGTTRDAYFEILERKTALLFAGCTECGAVLGGQDEDACKALHRYGLELGRAFQLVDDMLDYTSTSEHLGKPVFSDLTEGKLTLPVLLVLERAPKDAKPIIERAWSAKPKGISKQDASLLKELLEKHSIINEVRAEAGRASRAAANALPAALPGGDPSLASLLKDIPEMLLKRTR